jgi:hypothetical protein
MKVLACLSLVIVFAGCSKSTADVDAGNADVDVVDAVDADAAPLAGEVSVATDVTVTVDAADDVTAVD